MARARAKGKSKLHEGNLDLSSVQSRRISGDARALFGKHLNGLMLDRGISRSDLARYCFGTIEEKGFEVAAGRDRISKYLAGKSFPEYATLAKIAKKLDCTVDDLLPNAVKAALEGTTQPIVTVDFNPETGLHRVKMNAEFNHKFTEELCVLIAKYRGGSAVRRKRD